MTKTRSLLWLGVNAALTVVALYTALIDAIPKTFPESHSENSVIAVEGIVAWIASCVLWRLRCGVWRTEGTSRPHLSDAMVYFLYTVGGLVSLALYALRVVHSDYP